VDNGVLEYGEQVCPSVVGGIEALVDNRCARGGLGGKLRVRRVTGDDLDAVGDLRMAGSVDGSDRKRLRSELVDQSEADGPCTENDMDIRHRDHLSSSSTVVAMLVSTCAGTALSGSRAATSQPTRLVGEMTVTSGDTAWLVGS
jgi:hypothetical protein